MREFHFTQEYFVCHNETPDKQSFSCVAKFYKIEGKILEA